MAIGDGSATNRKVMQFANAEFVAPDTWELSLRLRGQAGTDAIMPPVWPVGSRVVILDGAPQQIELSLQAREVTRHCRIGPALRERRSPLYPCRAGLQRDRITPAGRATCPMGAQCGRP
ncbi:MAG: hypothetical protein R3D53_13520 [Paracoccaceae bacterium]